MPGPQIVLPDPPAIGDVFDQRVQAKFATWWISFFKQITNAHPFMPVDTTSGNQVIALPSGPIYLNQERLYQKTSKDVSSVTITGAQGGNVILGTYLARARFRYDGANWWPS
jgi:hypothetical protein